jgi:hypothetical protein
VAEEVVWRGGSSGGGWRRRRFGGGFGGGGFSGVAQSEVGNRLCKHSITKKSCKLQLFFVFLLITSEKNTSFIMLYTGKFLLLSTSRVPFLIILKLNIVLDFAFIRI